MKKCLLSLAFLLFTFTINAQTGEAYQKNTEQKVSNSIKIKVFPNPAVNVVNILGLANSNQASISISDLSGNIVLQRQWAIRNKSVSIPVPNLQAGIYVVSIRSPEQQLQTKFYKK